MQEVLGHIPLEFALVCGFASPLISLIARFVDIEVLLFHLFGDTSRGKTSAMRVFVSPFDGAASSSQNRSDRIW
ncbi:DUF927 domain-containing protein [Brevibacillus borstelensis]|uniref:DUF927 domain-containing protein n=1 Tax=Brevibacillus borstelensis TaxID=45462 RepID=UPI00203D3F8B|nr:DUF927 domain-containing protein [Brevibacillus borstelensis]MCM3590136.1 DUF927 domain-containing protein [Brevibacillus borstelensis]